MDCISKRQNISSYKNYTNATISIVLCIVSVLYLLFTPILALITACIALYLGFKGLNSMQKAIPIVGIILSSTVLLTSLITITSNIEVTSMSQIKNTECSLNTQVSTLREERISLEREKNTIVRLISEHDRLSSRSSLSDYERKRLIDISDELMRHSRYIFYRIDSTGIMASPSLKDEIDDKIKEIRLLELELERELSYIELQIMIDDLD